jgi:phage terminase large subunit
LGFNDAMSIIMAQKTGPSQIAVIDHLEVNQKTIDWCVAELRQRRYNWGYDWLPHDAMHRNYQSGVSTVAVMRRLGRKTKQIPSMSVESGIRTARMVFPRVYIDRTRGARLIDCLRHYRRSIPTSTGEPAGPVHDEYSHGADAWRYLSIVADRLSNELDDDLERTELAAAGSFYQSDPAMGY